MKKFEVKGTYTEIIYAESEDEALEQFYEITADYTNESFDEVEVTPIPLC